MDHAAALTRMGFAAGEALPEGLSPAGWGRNGENWYFVYEDPGAEHFMAQVEAVRKFVNGQYAMPRMLRFRSPYMLVLAVLTAPDPATVEAVRQSYTSGWMGGEVYHLAALGLHDQVLTLPEPKGNRNQRFVEALRLKQSRPDQLVLGLFA
jgi:hypothetical protein